MSIQSDTVVIVTGAAGGLGRAFAEAFAQEGARVACADRNEDGAQQSAALINANGGKAIAVKVDVTDEQSTQAMAQTVIAQWGQIDVLINNAAIYAGLKRKPFWEIAVDEWDRLMAVNVKGVWLASRAVFPYMRDRGGKIINISSATFFSGSTGWLHYVSSKGAVIGLTRSMAHEVGDFGITVNAIAPGFTLTEASYGIVENADQYGFSRGAIKRGAHADDIVGAALFLGGASSGFVTGQTLVVDGGRQLH